MFSKKAAPKKAKVLNEREIQERLYGFYHTSDMAGEAKPSGEKVSTQTIAAPKIAVRTATTDLFTPSEAAYVPKARAATPIDLDLGAEKETVSLNEIWTGITGQIQKWMKDALFLIKKIPQQYLIMGLVGVVFVVIVFPFFNSKRIPKNMTPSAGLRQTVLAVSPKPKEAALPVKSAVAVPGTSPLSPAAPVTPPVKTEKIYTVQLCLSDDEGASEDLIGRLKTKGFEAFSHKIQGGRGTYFQIYAGRYKNSAEAQTAMKKLRADSEFKMYNDSFVRVTQ